jgi:Fe2+ or Zn2+ uptake regulation protein
MVGDIIPDSRATSPGIRIQDEEIVRSLHRLGEGRGFAVERQVIEARGFCSACRSAHR